MKFDRSDRDPLALDSSPAAAVAAPSPPPFPTSSYLTLFVATSRAAKWRWRSSPGFPHLHVCPTGIDGRPWAPPSLAHVMHSLFLSFFFFLFIFLSLSRGGSAPHFIRFSFICYLPAVAAATTIIAAAGYAPSGHPLERVSLVPTRHLFTNTSHGLLALWLCSPWAPLRLPLSYRRIVVPS